MIETYPTLRRQSTADDCGFNRNTIAKWRFQMD
jgi:hypothetical protein